MDRDVDEIGKLNHSLDANIVHRAFDLGNMRLRDACLFLNIALAQACVFSGSAEVFCERLALQLAYKNYENFLTDGNLGHLNQAKSLLQAHKIPVAFE